MGVVSQTETAALKAAGGSKGPFARQLTGVYTKATFIDDEDDGPGVATQLNYIVCVRESRGAGVFKQSADERSSPHSIALVTSSHRRY